MSRLLTTTLTAFVLLSSCPSAPAGEWIKQPQKSSLANESSQAGHEQNSDSTTRSTEATTSGQTPASSPTSALKQPTGSGQAAGPLSTPSSSGAAFTTLDQIPVKPSSNTNKLRPDKRQKTKTKTSISLVDLNKFLDSVRENFSTWDRNHDGCIDSRELRLASLDDRYRGDPAVALAVLTHLADMSFEKSKELFIFKLDDLDAIEDKGTSGIASDFEYANEFQRLAKKLKTLRRALFTDSRPHLSSLKLCPGADACFAAAAGSLAEVDPKKIIEMISSDSSQYIVSLPGQNDISLSPLTDAELLENAESADGYWFYILQKAFNRYTSTARAAVQKASANSGAKTQSKDIASSEGAEKEPKTASDKAKRSASKGSTTRSSFTPSTERSAGRTSVRKKRASNSKTENVTKSSMSSTDKLETDECFLSLTALSGGEAKSIDLHPTSAKARDQENADTLVQTVLERKSEDHLMTIAISQEQAYVIAEYDAASQTLTIRNLSGASSSEQWTTPAAASLGSGGSAGSSGSAHSDASIRTTTIRTGAGTTTATNAAATMISSSNASTGPKMMNGYFRCSFSDFMKNFQTLWYSNLQQVE
jgi:hypothetical protein